MQLPLQTFSSLVSNAAAAVQGAASQLLDLTVGSVLRAVLEANASMALWLQWLILQVLRTTRAATSQGADLDSWVGDFGVARLPAVAAQGVLTFSRFVPQAQALIPAGVTARTGDGSQTFMVFADPTNPAWAAGQQGYVIAASAAAIALPAVAVTAGSGGNVQPGSISLIGGAIPGVDAVTNPASFGGGVDGETDAALRARFSLFLASRARSTLLAVSYALQGVQQGLSFSIAENTLPDFSARPGFFTITLDDGSGTPPAALLAAASGAVDAMRPIGSQFIIQPPVVRHVDVSLAIAVVPGTPLNAVAINVAAIITSYINGFPLGAPLTWSRLAAIAYNVDGRVINVTALLLNGGTADLVPASNAVLKAGTVTVS